MGHVCARRGPRTASAHAALQRGAAERPGAGAGGGARVVDGSEDTPPSAGPAARLPYPAFETRVFKKSQPGSEKPFFVRTPIAQMAT
jgi:hypothetical protein